MEQGHQLPQMVRGDGVITGLRSFIRQAHRSTITTTKTQKTTPMTGQDGITLASLNSIDSFHGYHNQLKVIHSVDTGRRESYPGSGGSLPLPQALEATQQQLRYQKRVSTGGFV